MGGRVLLLVAAAVVVCPAAGAGDTLYRVPPLDPGIFLVEGSGAVLAGAACAAGLGFLLTRLYDPSEDVWKTFGGTVLGGSLGYPVFCGFGCYGAGKLVRQQGRWQGAVIGALAATPVGLTLAWAATLIEHLPPGSIKSSPFYVIASLIPPAGAVVGYNMSRPKASADRSELRVLPGVAVSREAGSNGQPSTVIRVGLAARF